jgi:hypothetical protein
VIDRLHNAAPAQLRAWIDAHRPEVRAAIEAALTPRSGPRKLTHLQTRPAPAGNLLIWLKARAQAKKGVFDPVMFEAAIPYLGDGWRITTTTGLMRQNGSSNVLEGLLYAAGLRRRHPGAWQEYAPNTAWWAVTPADADSVLRIVTVPARDVGPGGVTVDRPDPGVVYVSDQGRGTWGNAITLRLKQPSVGVVAWQIRAPDGATTEVYDKPRPAADPLKADAFWKWAYAHGLDAAARAALPSQAQEKEAQHREAVAKGLGTCGVCFAVHAKHTRGSIVQHGYTMAGGGFHGHLGMYKTSGDCFGVGYPAFEASPAATLEYAVRLGQSAEAAAQDAEDWESGKHTRLHVFQRHGTTTLEDLPPYSIPPQDARVITIGPDDPSWARRVAKRAVEARNRSAGLANASAWYAEVAQRWPAYPPGLTPPVLG